MSVSAQPLFVHEQGSHVNACSKLQSRGAHSFQKQQILLPTWGTDGLSVETGRRWGSSIRRCEISLFFDVWRCQLKPIVFSSLSSLLLTLYYDVGFKTYAPFFYSSFATGKSSLSRYTFRGMRRDINSPTGQSVLPG